MDFSQRLGHIGEEHDAHAARDDIKGLGGEREGFGVGLLEGNVGHVVVLGMVRGRQQHLWHEIRGGDGALGTNRQCERSRRVSRPTRQV